MKINYLFFIINRRFIADTKTIILTIVFSVNLFQLLGIFLFLAVASHAVLAQRHSLA